MQKIVFVGIILIIGLFSLQLSLAGIYSSSPKAKVEKPQVPNIVPASNTDQCRIIYVYQTDSVVVIQKQQAICLPMSL